MSTPGGQGVSKLFSGALLRDLVDLLVQNGAHVEPIGAYLHDGDSCDGVPVQNSVGHWGGASPPWQEARMDVQNPIWKLLDKTFPEQAAEGHQHSDIEAPPQVPRGPRVDGEMVLNSKPVHWDATGQRDHFEGLH